MYNNITLIDLGGNCSI